MNLFIKNSNAGLTYYRPNGILKQNLRSGVRFDNWYEKLPVDD